MYSNLHKAIIEELSTGHLQLRELTKRVNKRLKSHYLESSVSARIRDLHGYYETLNQWKGGKRYCYYIAKPGALQEVRAA